MVAVLFFSTHSTTTNMVDRKEDVKRLEAILKDVDMARLSLPFYEFRDDIPQGQKQMFKDLEARLVNAKALLRAEIERRQLW